MNTVMSNVMQAEYRTQQRLLRSMLHWLTGLALCADDKGYVEITVNLKDLAKDIRQIQDLTEEGM